jgi:hypothetical protein
MLSPEQIQDGFIKATQSTHGAAERWRSRAEKEMTDEELGKALSSELGQGGSCGPNMPHLEYRGLSIWINEEMVNTHQTKPTFAGASTVAMARRVYGIRGPTGPQLGLL